MPKPPNGAEPSPPVAEVFDQVILDEPGGTRVAISTNLGGIRSWFIFDQNQGGYYSDGTLEELEYWHPRILDPDWEAPVRPDPEENAS